MKRVFAAAAMAVVLMAAPAAAQQYPPAVNSLTANCVTPAPGETIRLEGRTFADSGTVAFSLTPAAVDLGSATANDDGIVTLEATIPAGTPHGAHAVTASGKAPDGTTLSVSVALTVGAGCGAPAGEIRHAAAGSLPRTGDDTSIPLAKVGVGLAAFGGVVTAVAAKRRRRAASVA